jgi:hypothetical protein
MALLSMDWSLQLFTKQQRLMKPVTYLATRSGDPTSVTAWWPQPPLLLTEEEPDDLYAAFDGSRLQQVSGKQMKCSDLHPRMKKLLHKATRLLNHLKEEGANIILSILPWMDLSILPWMNPENDQAHFVLVKMPELKWHEIGHDTNEWELILLMNGVRKWAFLTFS